jgi:hypothetical protein
MPKQKPVHNVTADLRLMPEAQAIVGGFRGQMVQDAERNPLPPRFKVVPDVHTPAFHITDSETGRTVLVGLYAYEATRGVLHALYGDCKAKYAIGDKVRYFALYGGRQIKTAEVIGIRLTERGFLYSLKLQNGEVDWKNTVETETPGCNYIIKKIS